MGIIVRKHYIQNTNFNQLRGSGILPRGPICRLDKCIPKSNSTPAKPVPQRIKRLAPKPLIAVKKSSSNNVWCLSGIRYPDFNTLWVNIPRGSYTVLRINGNS